VPRTPTCRGGRGRSDEYISSRGGDVNGDSLPDLIVGHDRGGTDLPYFYTGKVYIYYGRTAIAPEVDLGTGADVTSTVLMAASRETPSPAAISTATPLTTSVSAAYLDSPAGAMAAGGVAVIYGQLPKLPATWDFNTTPPDLYISSANAPTCAAPAWPRVTSTATATMTCSSGRHWATGNAVL